MPQMHLYVPERLAKAIRRQAEERGLSVSRFLAAIVRREVERGWPEGFFEQVIGGWVGELERPEPLEPEARDELR